MEKLYTTGEVAKLFRVSYVAVKKWAYAGKIKFIKTPGGKYRYPESEVRRLLGELAPKGKAVVYARVSSADQKEDLERQKKRLLEYAESKGYLEVTVLEDIASGLNENRKGLAQLFELVSQKQVEAVFISHKDRLARFGFKYLEAFFSSHACRIEALNKEETKEPQQELVEDLVAIVTSFAGRIYGSRSHKKQKVVEAVKDALRED
ncbi:MAG: IS607 family transposase [Candidatus Freyarchaeota archaeon]|nr:IS607 family transposase [Candidatus Jordarchaeia archaeon]MBS7270208.1 IS607 family transposase [Candidatus Jordarchaeia archaeon]MBS7280627.1 IS607 family transposase [Candidatus Jordarchaeia archaeon]